MRLSQQEVEQLTPELWEVRLAWEPGWFLKLLRVKTQQYVYHGQGGEWMVASPTSWNRVAEGTIKQLVIEIWRAHCTQQEYEKTMRKLEKIEASLRE